jgi:murein DD-endopeptidase MepM/ murein hydrolase activator NlpD
MVVARHRSPQGRRAHLEPPLSAAPAAAGAGGAHRSKTLPQLTSSLSARFVATAVAGGALAATGQHALPDAPPSATDGSNVLRVGAEELLGDAAEPATVAPPAAQLVAATAPLAAQPLVALAPVAPEPAVVDAANLVKAADLQRVAAQTAARSAEQAMVAQAARVAEAAKRAQPVVVPAAAAGAVQMITGRVTSGFGARWGTSHQGLDIAAPIGTPIRVPLAGTVIDSGPASGFGLWVRVKHADGTITVYGHINRSLVGKGQKVSAGQVIAEVGNRGQSTGPHLHIEVITPGGQKINPRPWLDARGIGYS